MPDYIEKQLYKNVFSICLGILDTVLDTVKVEFMGIHFCTTSAKLRRSNDTTRDKFSMFFIQDRYEDHLIILKNQCDPSVSIR